MSEIHLPPQTHKSHALEGVPDEVLLECLVTWPEGTRGYYDEIALIKLLNDLCKKHGYGGLPQYAKWIEDIWRNPEKVEEYKRMAAKRRELMKETQRYYAENPQTTES